MILRAFLILVLLAGLSGCDLFVPDAGKEGHACAYDQCVSDDLICCNGTCVQRDRCRYCSDDGDLVYLDEDGREAIEIDCDATCEQCLDDADGLRCEVTEIQASKVCGATREDVLWVDACGETGEVFEVCEPGLMACREDIGGEAACLCPGGWDLPDCTVCKSGYDEPGGCIDCLYNRDPQADCAECLPGWSGPDCLGHQCADGSCSVVLPTGQTDCYDDTTQIDCPASGAFYAQDASFPEPYAREFTRREIVRGSGEYVIFDHQTGLLWQDPAGLHRSGVLFGGTECEDLTWASLDDWRTPNIHELLDLMNSQPAGVKVYAEFTLPAGQGQSFWSKDTYHSPIPGSGWVGNFADGGMAVSDGVDSQPYVWCVRGPEMQVPDPRFRAVDDGGPIIVDDHTGLVWFDPYLNDSTWEEALDVCDGNNHSTHGWRLPNVNELRSLLDPGHYNPATAAAPDFIDPLFDSGTMYWTSTTMPQDVEHAYLVDMDRGPVYGYLDKNDPSGSIICVSEP